MATVTSTCTPSCWPAVSGWVKRSACAGATSISRPAASGSSTPSNTSAAAPGASPSRSRPAAAAQDLDFVFPSAVGTPLDGANVYHHFKKLLVQAGLPSSHRPYDLRHSTATYLLAAGVPARVVMELLGHSQI